MNLEPKTSTMDKILVYYMWLYSSCKGIQNSPSEMRKTPSKCLYVDLGYLPFFKFAKAVHTSLPLQSTKEMGNQSRALIAGISIGVTIGLLLVICTFLCIRLKRRRAEVQRSSGDQRGIMVPIRINGADSNKMLSDSTVGHEQIEATKQNGHSAEKILLQSASAIPRYSFKDLQKATHNFTTLLGRGSFGPVYKARMPTGETVAVKVLATNSKQGEREFQTEVLLLGRLHHRNLVNLLGYCVDKGHRMLVYEFMSNGSLANHLYNEEARPLSWEERFHIAQDVSHGIEYLHDGAVPSVVHRDIKSANILLDHLMRARVADFGLSKEEIFDGRVSGLKGTYGYMDPEYMSTNTCTKKSDVYSFGIFLFELITGRNPQQGLMDYVNLAALSADGKAGWEEILDSRLNVKCNVEEVGSMAALAYKCVRRIPRKRPDMRDVSQVLSKIQKKYRSEHQSQAFPVSQEENSEVVERIGHQIIELNTLGGIKDKQELDVV